MLVIRATICKGDRYERLVVVSDLLHWRVLRRVHYGCCCGGHPQEIPAPILEWRYGISHEWPTLNVDDILSREQ